MGCWFPKQISIVAALDAQWILWVPMVCLVCLSLVGAVSMLYLDRVVSRRLMDRPLMELSGSSRT